MLIKMLVKLMILRGFLNSKIVVDRELSGID